tara:strand:+ start:104 stop:421 length:318 start_codon:yes stop_codon:yes gene_type:complete
MLTGDQVPGRKPEYFKALWYLALAIGCAWIGLALDHPVGYLIFGMLVISNSMQCYAHLITGTKHEKLTYVDPDTAQPKKMNRAVRGAGAFAAGYIAGKKTGMDQE